MGLFALHDLDVRFALWIHLAGRRACASAGRAAGYPFVGCTLCLARVLGALATRYCDPNPIIESSRTQAFLSAPIIWTSDFGSRGLLVLRSNPLTHLFAVWRDPPVTGHVELARVACVLAIAAGLAIASVVTIAQLRKAVAWI